VEDTIDELLGNALDTEDDVVIALLVVQVGDGSDHKEAQDKNQLK
jgi:hypothetical protein